MHERWILEISLDESTYNLYYHKYYDAKSRDHRLTHNEFLKQLMGMR